MSSALCPPLSPNPFVPLSGGDKGDKNRENAIVAFVLQDRGPVLLINDPMPCAGLYDWRWSQRSRYSFLAADVLRSLPTASANFSFNA